MRNMRKIPRLFALVVALVPTFGFAERIDWPPLPQTCFVKGRPATEDDAKKGCAAFVIKAQGKRAGIPLNIDIPQYAIHIEDGSGKETPVVVIQAEENSGIQAVGYKVVGSSAVGASLLRELRLLGTKKPK
jgi:hypothetical protein